MNTPISSGINTAPTTALPTDSDKISISGNKNKDCRIVGRGVNVDTGISVYLKLNIADVNAFELRVNGVKQDITKLQSESAGEYLFTYTALSYAEIGAGNTKFEIYYNGELEATMLFGPNAFTYAENSKVPILDEEYNNLLIALYRFAKSAKAYI